MKKYEYRYIELEGTCIDSENTLKELNKLGYEGWQLVSQLREGSRYKVSTLCGMFMREKR